MNHLYPEQSFNKRQYALLTFASLITLAVIFGQLILSFEQSIIQVASSIFTACLTQLLLIYIYCKINRSKFHAFDSVNNILDAILPAWITGCAIAILLFSNVYPVKAHETYSRRTVSSDDAGED